MGLQPFAVRLPPMPETSSIMVIPCGDVAMPKADVVPSVRGHVPARIDGSDGPGCRVGLPE